jgi:hypothetical protein
MHRQVHTHIHTYIHTYIHIYIHTQLHSESFVYSRHFDVAKYENYNPCLRNVRCELVALLQRRQSCYMKKHEKWSIYLVSVSKPKITQTELPATTLTLRQITTLQILIKVSNYLRRATKTVSSLKMSLCTKPIKLGLLGKFIMD